MRELTPPQQGYVLQMEKKKKDFDSLLNADNHKITSYIVSESHYQHDHMKYDHVFTLSDLYDNKMNLMNLFLFNDGDSVAVIQLL